jgi:hypothetical protein
VALNLIAVFAASPASHALLAFIDPSLPAPIREFAAFVSSLALFAAFCALQLGPLDRLLRALERRPALRRFFTASFTRGYRRYVAPGFKRE